MAENKVCFNLKNVHYAKLTLGASPSWSTPVAVAGAVSLSLSGKGEVTPFYADGVTYYNSVSNNGYEGDIELARVPDSFLEDILGMTLGNSSKVITENANAEPSPFALLFEIDGDAGDQRYVLYNCTATRPALASTTNTESKEPQTQTMTITAQPLADGKIMARTTADTPTTTKNNFFSTVFVEA